MKSFLKSRIGSSIVSWLFHKYCVLAFFLSRSNIQNHKIYDDLSAKDEPLILAFWHGRMCFMPFISKEPSDIYVLISQHNDGELIAKVMSLFKLKHVRGSSNRSAKSKKGYKDRGGIQALRESIKLLNDGKNIAITPDGPKGPRMVAQEGLVIMAKKSGAKILPVTFSSSMGKIFKSWDRFLLPLPFGKSFFIFGDPVTVSKDADEKALEKARKKIENQLNRITYEADTKAGITPIEAAQ